MIGHSASYPGCSPDGLPRLFEFVRNPHDHRGVFHVEQIALVFGQCSTWNRPQMVWERNPPSTRRSMPVTNELAVELARKIAAPTNSSAFPKRPMGV